MTIAAIALFAALSGSPAPQAAPPPHPEVRTDVRVITVGGPDGPGRGPGRLDADNDGVVTRGEFTSPVVSAFDRLDADNDGRLTTAELAADHGPGGPDGPGAHVMMMRGGPEGGSASGPGERRVEVRRFGGPGGRGMDTNSDGKVSEAEFLAPMREAFQSMDADHDGSLDDSEEPHGPPPPPAPPASGN